MIYTIRDTYVMIDRDLAELYGVETKVLNQAVKRNGERFPESFRFRLTKQETYELVTNCDRFLIIDDSVYHIGASVKDLGKKWFAVSLMEAQDAGAIISRLEAEATHSDGKSPKIRQEAVAPTGGLPGGAQNRIFITMMRAMQRTRRTPDMPQTPRVSSRVVKTTSWLASIQMQKMVKRMTLIT